VEPAPNAPSKPEGSLTGSCCTKKFVHPEVSTLPYPEKPVLADATLAVVLAVKLPVIWPAPTEACCFRLEHRRPPPTDLLITLQRFLI
jgi:hypothetical protein